MYIGPWQEYKLAKLQKQIIEQIENAQKEEIRRNTLIPLVNANDVVNESTFTFQQSKSSNNSSSVKIPKITDYNHKKKIKEVKISYLKDEHLKKKKNKKKKKKSKSNNLLSNSNLDVIKKMRKIYSESQKKENNQEENEMQLSSNLETKEMKTKLPPIVNLRKEEEIEENSFDITLLAKKSVNCTSKLDCKSLDDSLDDLDVEHLLEWTAQLEI